MRNVVFIIGLVFLSIPLQAQRRTDANLYGHVVSGSEHIPFATIQIQGTTIGTTTDETGHFRFINLPEGDLVVIASALGYRSQEQTLTIRAGETRELNFELEPDVLGLDEVVVTADRNAQRRRDASVIVNTIGPRVFSMTQSVSLSDGLNFSPGLRMETSCQTCGFTQLRLNGMEGAYTQILINGQPIFSGLAAVYGLELIPANMVERVEVIRGGGSALFGSNAIAGTVNLILNDPVSNVYEVGFNSSLTGVGLRGSGGQTPDNNLTFNASVVSPDINTGLAVYGFSRHRSPFDANNDQLSEITSLRNTSLGARAFQRFGHRSKLTADFFNIREARRGGDRFDLPVHLAQVAEALDHTITTGALTFDQLFREVDALSVFVSGQMIGRASYYGAGQSLRDYGQTDDFTYNLGAQYKFNATGWSLTTGFESKGSHLRDVKLGYHDIDAAEWVDGRVEVPIAENRDIAHQDLRISGAFAQVEHRLGRLRSTLGLRYDYYRVADRLPGGEVVQGHVLSPRVSLLYDVTSRVQGRLSYSQGYRAPQVFDEDLHIFASGVRRVIHRNAPGLQQENSRSLMASVDMDQPVGSWFLNLLVEGFHTRLINPFVTEFGPMDAEGVVVYTRVNAQDGATVQGLNTELNVIPGLGLSFTAGLTVQSSRFDQPQEFDERRFFRSPSTYGFYTLDWQATPRLRLSTTGAYTGAMLVPYFGPLLPDPEAGELRRSSPFFDLGANVRYDVRVNGATLQLFGGVKNILNSYQRDFDFGPNRDPEYIYGPSAPRTIYLGLRIGNRLR